MIEGDDINTLVRLLEEREISLYHACQLVDFHSYLKLGGIPSRALLEGKSAHYTAFQTDNIDRENEVWDKVFVNLLDFGAIFAKGANNIPNPYGPILFQVRPAALCQAIDMAVCLWSAGAKGFQREREALKIDEIDRLFVYPSQAPYPQKTFVKFRDDLKREFRREKVQDPETSCTYRNGLLPLEYVSVVWVDPYMLLNRPLYEWVNDVKKEFNTQFPVHNRRCTSEARERLYDEIARVVIERTPSLSEISRSTSVSGALREWAGQLIKADLEWQFRRFAQYLREGTLLPVSTGAFSIT